MHLYHGLWTIFSLPGVSHPRYTRVLKWAAHIFALLIAPGFISLPVGGPGRMLARIRVAANVSDQRHCHYPGLRHYGLSDASTRLLARDLGDDASLPTPVAQARRPAAIQMNSRWKRGCVCWKCAAFCKHCGNDGRLEVWRVRVQEDMWRVASSRLCDYRNYLAEDPRCSYQPPLALASV
jgi:hypothetical protein